MRFSDLFPGVAFATFSQAARAAGYSPKTLRNKFYAGENPLGAIRVDGRLVVPAESFDNFLERAYLKNGLMHLVGDAPAALSPAPTIQKRQRGRPRKIARGAK